jgi:hypothetical protein
MTELILTLPLPPSKNSEKAMHYRKRDRERDRWKLEAVVAWSNAGRVKMSACTIIPVFYVRNIRDDDNCSSLATKAIQDGLKGRLVPDDSPKYLALGRPEQHIDRKNPRLELRITEVELGHPAKSSVKTV